MVAKKERKQDKKRRVEDANQAARPMPNAKWVQAFMIMLLHKVGGSFTLSFDDLKRFEKLKGDNKTSLDFDDLKRTVTILAPEYDVPEKSVIVLNKKIITT